MFVTQQCFTKLLQNALQYFSTILQNTSQYFYKKNSCKYFSTISLHNTSPQHSLHKNTFSHYLTPSNFQQYQFHTPIRYQQPVVQLGCVSQFTCTALSFRWLLLPYYQFVQAKLNIHNSIGDQEVLMNYLSLYSYVKLATNKETIQCTVQRSNTHATVSSPLLAKPHAALTHSAPCY